MLALAPLQDQQNQLLRKINLTTALVTTVAGTVGLPGTADGVGTAAGFNTPSGVTMNAAGTLALVADWQNSAVRRVNLTTGAVTTLAGKAGNVGTADGVGSSARFTYPVSVGIAPSGTFALVVSGRERRALQG